jgi:hypothetical protein
MLKRAALLFNFGSQRLRSATTRSQGERTAGPERPQPVHPRLRVLRSNWALAEAPRLVSDLSPEGQRRALTPVAILFPHCQRRNTTSTRVTPSELLPRGHPNSETTRSLAIDCRFPPGQREPGPNAFGCATESSP